MNHTILAPIRLAWMQVEFLVVTIGYAWQCGFWSKDSIALARARWLQWASRRFLRVFGLRPEAYGPVPETGLLVCNHLGYLDIIVLASIAPCVFVAKSDVRRWPVLGWFAAMAGTIFVNRESRMDASQTTAEIQATLDKGILVILFPEGTSSGGEAVLPFKSALLAPAETGRHPICAARIRYELPKGDVAEEVCYWKDMTLAPHMWNLLGKRGLRAGVRFSLFAETVTDRKELARSLHRQVTSMWVVLGA